MKRSRSKAEVQLPIHLGKPYKLDRAKAYINEVLDSGWVAGCGPMTKRFEELASNILGVKPERVIAVSSCTVALRLAWQMLYKKVERRYCNTPYTPVLTLPSYTFIASYLALHPTNSKHALTDLGRDLVNSDWSNVVETMDNLMRTTKANPINECVANLINECVHQYGIVNKDAVQYAVNGHVIHDAACAFGACYPGTGRNHLICEPCEDTGIPLGSDRDPLRPSRFEEWTCFSFHARKNFTSGEGGLLVAPSEERADEVRSLRNFGFDHTPHEVHGVKGAPPLKTTSLEGFNWKMSDLQAAVGLSQLEMFSEIALAKRKLYQDFQSAMRKLELWNNDSLRFRSMPKLESWDIPQNYRILVSPGPNWKYDHQPVERLLKYLHNNGVMAKRTISPLHCNSDIRDKTHSFPIDLKWTDAVSRDGIWLPFYAGMTGAECDYIFTKIKEWSKNVV